MNKINKNDINPTLDANVPNHWVIVPLENILETIIGGGTPSRSNRKYWGGTIPWLTVKDMRTRRPKDSMEHISEEAVEASATRIIPEDTVIIATRIGLGKVIRVPFKTAINQDLKALIVLRDVDKGYLEYWFLSIANYLASIGSGTTVKGVRLEQLRTLPFPLAPMDEQKRIVAEIEKQFSRLDRAVENLKRVKSNLKRYKAAVLKAAVEGKLTEQWRKDHPNVEPAAKLLERILTERRKRWEETELAKMKAKGNIPKDDKWKEKYKQPTRPIVHTVNKLPQSWIPASIDQLSLLVTDGDHNPPKRLPNGIPHLTAKNIIYDKIVEKGCTYISAQDYDKVRSRYEPQENDVIITCVGTIGRQAIVPKSYLFSADRNLAAVRLYHQGMLPKILKLNLDAPDAQLRIKNASGSTAQPHFYLSNIRSFFVVLMPYEEQKEIIQLLEKKISEIENLDILLVMNLKRANRLRQSILKKAFSGQLIPSAKEYEPETSLELPLAAEATATYGAKH